MKLYKFSVGGGTCEGVRKTAQANDAPQFLASEAAYFGRLFWWGNLYPLLWPPMTLLNGEDLL